jgi:hypothetical protein
MGRYSSRGRFSLMPSSNQAENGQDNLSSKVEKLNEKLLIKQLENSNTKFNKEEMKFITKDESGQTIWLETGSSLAGLKHIIARHEKDFKKAYNVSKEQIPTHIKNVITKGKLIDKTDSGVGYTKVYKYKSKYYLVTGIGYNGFIVSAYPYDYKGGKNDKH